MKILSNVLMTIIAIGLIVFAWPYLKEQKRTLSKAATTENSSDKFHENETNILPEWVTCEKDEDCTPVGIECCEGQYTHAINKNYMTEWQLANSKTECPTDQSCITVVPQAWCENGECRGGDRKPIDRYK